MANIIYISHGGRPLPLWGDDSHKSMVTFLQKIGEILPKTEVDIPMIQLSLLKGLKPDKHIELGRLLNN